MNEFNPGDGWRRLGPDDGLIGPGETYIVLHEPDGDTHFVREVPVPPLPTEPRAVTAKAVLDRVRDELQQYRDALDAIARDFGVES